MGGCNNQPKVGRNDGICFGRRRAGRAAAASFGLSNYWTNEIHCGIRRPPINNCTQQPTKLTWVQWGRDISGCGTGGECRGKSIRRFGWEGGEIKIDAFIKLIIFLAGLSIWKKSFLCRVDQPIAMRLPGAGGC